MTKYNINENHKFRITIAILLILSLVLVPITPWRQLDTWAKTAESPQAKNLFVYVKNDEDKDILLKTLPLDALKTMQHGNDATPDPDDNYYFSAIDNLPAIAYTEAKGFTAQELLETVKNTTSVISPAAITFGGNDAIELMATDSNGTYNKSWTYDELYGQQGYYYPDIFDATTGWTSAWTVTGDGYSPESTPAMPLPLYMSSYKDADPTYDKKAAVSESAIEMDAIFAVDSVTDRIDNLAEEYGKTRAEIIASGLPGELSDAYRLTLCVPQTPDVLFSANHTMHHYFKWIYNIRLNMADAPTIPSLGEVESPTADIRVDPENENRLIVDFDVATSGASIYYSIGKNNAISSSATGGAIEFGTAPVHAYTGESIAIDLKSGADLKTTPIKIYMTAVKEGYTDNGIQTISYPKQSPDLKRKTNEAYHVIGEDVVYELTSPPAVTNEAWIDWTSNITAASIKVGSDAATPLVSGAGFRVDNAARTFAIDTSSFTKVGSYVVKIDADGYSQKTLNFTMRKAAPTISSTSAYYGNRIDISVPDKDYLMTGIRSIDIRKDGTDTTSKVTIPTNRYLMTAGADGKPGTLTISPDYYGDINTVIDGSGTYIIGFNTNDYLPARQEMTVEIKAAGDNPNGFFEYSLAPSKASGTVGDTIKVTASLKSQGGDFTFYGGEYRIAIDAGMTVKNIQTANGWESGTTTSDKKTILTFAKLEPTSDGELTTSVSALGTFDVTLDAVGTGNLTATNALLTDDIALNRNNVSGKSLSIQIAPKANLNQKTPAAPKLTYKLNADKKTYTVTIPKVAGAEYSFDGKTFSAASTANVKKNVAQGKVITGYIRLAAKAGYNASGIASSKVTLPVRVTKITVTSKNNTAVIKTKGGKLQLTATASPAKATNKSVTWKVVSGTAGTVNSKGVLTAKFNGKVTVRATAKDGTGVYGQKMITLSNQAYKVTFNSNGGTAITAKAVNKNAKVSKPTNPKKTGYTFKGWYTDTKLKKAYSFSSKVTSNKTLYAKWAANKYAVTYDAHGGKIGKAKTVKKTIAYAARYTLPATPKRSGYTFSGWYTTNKATGGTKVTNNVQMKTAKTHTLYARWKKK